MVPLFIIGMRGSGKTTIGKLLSKYLKYNFVDTDHIVCVINGKSIQDIIKIYGWSYFRSQESKVLKFVSDYYTIVSTGGGIVLSDDNCVFMRSKGKIIYLRTSVNELYNRIMLSPKVEQRPKLTNKVSLIDEIRSTMYYREKMYANAANYVFDSVNISPEDLVVSIINTIR